MDYYVRFGIDERDRIVRDSLVSDYRELLASIRKYEESGVLSLLAMEELGDNRYYLDGLKVVLKYYLPRDEYLEVVGGE